MSGDKGSPVGTANWSRKKPLGEALREQYKQVLNEPVPEKLKKLIEALKEQEKKQDD